jgi:hypothetical protein
MESQCIYTSQLEPHKRMHTGNTLERKREHLGKLAVFRRACSRRWTPVEELVLQHFPESLSVSTIGEIVKIITDR